MKTLFTSVRLTALATAFLIALAAAPAGAQNREHQQMAAELRMLQEQNQQFSLLLQQVMEALKATNQRIDDAAARTREGFANQATDVKNLAGDVGAIRERTQDTDTRIRSLSDEIAALQATITQLATAIAQNPGAFNAPAGPLDPNAQTGAPGIAPAPVPPLAPIAPPLTTGLSPSRMLEQARNDYYSGQYQAAITQFEAIIATFGQTEAAGEANYWIGESQYSLNRWADAVAAYNRVIQNFPRSTFVPSALYKRGLAHERAGDLTAARASWEQVIKQFPQDMQATLAKQNLDRVNRAVRP